MKIGRRIHHRRSASQVGSLMPAILAGNGRYRSQLPNPAVADTGSSLTGNYPG